MSLKNELIEHLKQFSSAPFLFVGSGLSRRYLGLETWSDLLEKFTQGTGQSYAYYRSGADGNYPKIASALAINYREMWFKEDRFAQSRADYDLHIKNQSSPLKIAISEYIKAKSSSAIDLTYTDEIDLLQSSVVDGIITTNWDTLLESLFPGFTVYIGQNNLLFSQQLSVAEIYKIHGCCSDPNSLVLTDEDYAEFNSRNPYLAARLLSVFVEHPVIFLGYSINDQHIKDILVSIVQCLTTDNIGMLTDRLIFVDYDSQSEGELSRQSIIIEGKALPLTVVRAANFAPIYEALNENKRKYSARVLRRLKNQVYNLALTTEPQERMFVKDIDDDTDESKIEVVFGVGVIPKIGSAGYRSIGKQEIFRDVIFGGTNLDARQVIEITLTDLIRQTPNAAWPVFKYLKEGGFLSSGRNINGTSFDSYIKKAIKKNKAQPPVRPTRRQQNIAASTDSIDDINQANNFADTVSGLLGMPPERLSLDDLQRFLQRSFESLASLSTDYRKLVCKYDYLRYGKDSQL